MIAQNTDIYRRPAMRAATSLAASDPDESVKGVLEY
jgi:hypothetical protein